MTMNEIKHRAGNLQLAKFYGERLDEHELVLLAHAMLDELKPI